MFPSTSSAEILYECVLSPCVLHARLSCFCKPVHIQETEYLLKRVHGLLGGPICISDDWIRVSFETELYNLYNVQENTAVIKLLGDQTSVFASTGKFSERWILFQIDVAGRWRGLCHLVTVILLSRPVE
jgi:hypothetical protein